MEHMGKQPVPELKTVIPVRNVLGECVLWDAVRGQMLWTDIVGRKLYTYDPETHTTAILDLEEELCAFALIEGSDKLLGAFRSGFRVLDRSGRTSSWLHRVQNTEKVRLNDGRVDRQGRFWCGSLMDTASNQPEPDVSAELYRVSHDGVVTTHLTGIGISNSICWSPDSSVMYFADTTHRVIWAFDFDKDDGAISNQRVFARTQEPCGPDGSVVDADGCLWNAEWGHGRVVRYNPDGSIHSVLQLPASHVTCVAFGGADLSDLYVTSATQGLSKSHRAAEPEAGNVFVYSTPYRGLPESRFINNIP